jgi:hypothetical protein
MPRSKTKRLLIAGAGIVGILAIVGASFFVHYSTSHAAAGGNNPHVLSSNFLSTHHAQAGYGNLPSRATAKVNTKAVGHNPNKVSSGGNSACVPGINGISNFCTTFSEPGLDAAGNPNNNWTTNFVGNPPQNGVTTTIGAPIIPVKVVLMGADGNPEFTVDPEGDVQPVVNSPIYSATKYSSSSKPTQFTDAVQRAEFHSVEKTSWHTLLAPSVKPEVTMTIPSGDWFVGLNADGSVAFTLVDAGTFNSLLFPASFPVDNSTLIGQEELNGTMTTKNISTFLFDNVYLFENGDPNQCCVLGFHGPDVEPGPNGTLNNFDMIYASWITPGLFLGGAADITALSHEMSETYEDPFGGAYFPYAYVPWWFSGPDPSFTQCQPLMEDGDVVEVYSVVRSDVTDVTINGMTYHPQTMALLQWFESNGTSDAIDGAFSYPDESILTTSNVSQQPGCTGPA